MVGKRLTRVAQVSGLLEHDNAQNGMFLEGRPIERIARVCRGLRMKLHAVPQDANMVGGFYIWDVLPFSTHIVFSIDELGLFFIHHCDKIAERIA